MGGIQLQAPPPLPRTAHCFYLEQPAAVHQLILDFLKRSGRSPIQSVEDPEVLARPEPTDGFAPSVNVEREEIAEVTHKVLAELPALVRAVGGLREFGARA